jgi:signal transduction histidine kinase
MTDPRPRVLVVDDQPDNRLVLEDLLSADYLVATASDGAAALACLDRPGEPFDLVLLDVVMPGLDGFEVCLRLRSRPALNDLPIIFLSGLETADDEERGLSLGADDFIHKPFVPLLVLARVRNVIGRRQAAVRARTIAVFEARIAEQQRTAEAMQTMIARLTEANTELERFAFVAAHDLREPLRSITSFAQLLERHLGDGLDPRGHEYLGFIIGGARRLNDLIGGLLVYSHLTANIGPPSPVSAAAACRAALDTLAAIIADSGAVIDVAPLPMVVAQDLPLVQVFQNLIGNALKFRAPDRVLHVAVTAEPDGTDWHVAVHDNGVGFDPEEQDVFDLFRQLHPFDGPGGSGLGLAICKRIIHTLGGRIWVDSRRGLGSVFHFTLPAALDLS